MLFSKCQEDSGPRGLGGFPEELEDQEEVGGEGGLLEVDSGIKALSQAWLPSAFQEERARRAPLRGILRLCCILPRAPQLGEPYD